MVKLVELLSKFEQSTNAHMWMCLIKNLENICKLFLETEVSTSFQAFLLKLFAQVVAHVGYEPRPDDGKIWFCNRLLRTAC